MTNGNTHKLFSVGEVRLEPFIGFASYSIMMQFQQKDRMIYCIKSFFKSIKIPQPNSLLSTEQQIDRGNTYESMIS